MDDLGRVGGQEEQVHHEQRRGGQCHQPAGCVPALAGDVEEQQRRDRDRAGHRHAEGEGECGGAAECEDEGDDRDQ